MGNDYDQDMCSRYFVPQLRLYFLRFLDIYDRALEGMPISDYIRNLPHRRAVLYYYYY